jgi:hypothetical protein
MIEFGGRKMETARDQVELLTADMNCFRLDKPVDFVFVQVGSLFVANDDDIKKHLCSVADALRPGGLYFLDGCITFGEELVAPEGVTWEMERDGIKVKTNVTWRPVNRAKQLFTEKITFDVTDHGKELHLEGSDIRRAIYPQEFLQLVGQHPSFEFVGWWHLWDLERPLDKVESPDWAIAVIRRL